MAERLQRLQQSIERGGVSDSERATRERELNEQGREFQRLQVQFREDLQQRRNEELSSVIEAADKAVKQIADRDKFDIILQEAIYFSPRVDITDQVIKMLNEGRVR
jgi:outer membrane protein